ncbi:hypothetical protein D3C77_626660 [compost metagenome]
MDIDLVHLFLLGKVEHREQMVNMAVYAAVREKPVQVKLLPVSLRAAYSIHQSLILKKFAFADRFGNPGQVLVHDTSRTDVQVTYLGVAHLPFRQTYGLSASG